MSQLWHIPDLQIAMKGPRNRPPDIRRATGKVESLLAVPTEALRRLRRQGSHHSCQTRADPEALEARKILAWPG